MPKLDIIDKLNLLRMIHVDNNENKAACIADEAMEEIEILQQKLADAEKQNEWISVEDRLPEIDTPVCLYNDNRFMNYHFDMCWHGVGYLSELNYWSVIGDSRGQCLDSVTHWKPIKPPQDESKGE